MELFSGSGGKTSEEKEHEKCNERLMKTVKENTKVQYMIDSIEKLGCKIPSSFFACRTCDGDISGGFVIDNSENVKAPYIPQILVCQNKQLPTETFEQTIIHELVHAYDKCRSKLTLSNCEQHACTEIRASNISGECDLYPELKRGNTKMYNGGAECSKRRAALSVSMNPACKDVSAVAIDTVFKRCMADISPFTDEEQLNN